MCWVYIGQPRRVLNGRLVFGEVEAVKRVLTVPFAIAFEILLRAKVDGTGSAVPFNGWSWVACA